MCLRFALWLGLLAVACGGRVERSDEPPAPGSSSAAPDDQWGGTPLGECAPGWEPDGSECPFFADDTCYETKAAACNCICPRDHDSWCVSDFASSTEGTAFVQCF